MDATRIVNDLTAAECSTVPPPVCMALLDTCTTCLGNAGLMAPKLVTLLGDGAGLL